MVQHYRARYYDPQVGRFLSEDPAAFSAGVNFYGYAGARPTNVADPFGIRPQVDDNKIQPKPWDFRDYIIELLKGDNRCSCWLIGNSSLANAVDIISHVRITLYTGSPQSSGDTPSTPRSDIRINDMGSFYPWGKYGIGRNHDGSPIYEAGSFEAQMVILLHELAHKLGPQGFQDDGGFGREKESEENTNLMIENCRVTIHMLAVLHNKK